MQRIRGQAGMSLVEVVAATAIIVVALAPLLNVFLTSQKGVGGASRQVEAMAVARSAMDAVLQENYHDMATGVRPWAVYGSDYETQITVTQVTAYMKRILVEVRWPDKGGYKTVSLYSTAAQRTKPPEPAGG